MDVSGQEDQRIIEDGEKILGAVVHWVPVWLASVVYTPTPHYLQFTFVRPSNQMQMEARRSYK